MCRFFLFLGLCSVMRAMELSQPTFEGASYTVCKVDLRKDRLRLFLTAPDGRPYVYFDRMVATQKKNSAEVIFAMNAGMFERNFSPVGLLIAEGREISPINLKQGTGNFYLKPNGVFAVAKGGFVVVASEKWSAVEGPVQLATQSGPLLVENGRIHSGFSANSTSFYVRNAVGVQSANEACLVISDRPVSFHQLARFMKVGLGCPDALYLDGAVSSIYAPALRRNDAKYNLGPMIGVIRDAAVK